jgi:hypothetical protein
MYSSQTNWKYDKNLYHSIQSGPQHTADDLNLTNTYTLVSSAYVPSGLAQQSWYGVNDQGADFGNIPKGPPNISGFLTTEWRAVPPAVSGYWTNYQNVLPHGSGVLDAYTGYRGQALYSVANATVQTAFGPQPGLRDIGTYTWFGAAVPDNQRYDPFQTPANNTVAEGSTGGPNSYQRVRFPILTNPTNDTSGSRAAWEYNQPVYCQTFSEAVRSDLPGQMSTVIRNMYRGRSSRYVPNYGSVYGVLGEGVRNLVRTFSSSVNSSNQKGI